MERFLNFVEHLVSTTDFRPTDYQRDIITLLGVNHNTYSIWTAATGVSTAIYIKMMYDMVCEKSVLYITDDPYPANPVYDAVSRWLPEPVHRGGMVVRRDDAYMGNIRCCRWIDAIGVSRGATADTVYVDTTYRTARDSNMAWIYDTVGKNLRSPIFHNVINKRPT